MLLISLPASHCQYLTPVLELLGDSPTLQEILWNFSRFKDEKKHLALREHPHFYAELPTSPAAYASSVKIDPTEDFRHSNKFYVLTDNPELVHITTNQVSQSSGNLLSPPNAIIFKGLVSCFVFFLLLISL